MNRIDLTGQKFGRLTVIEKCGKDKNGKNVLWLCSCECGGQTKTSTTHLRSGHTQSCGCRIIDLGKNTRFKTTHGKSRSRIYRIYNGMLDRVAILRTKSITYTAAEISRFARSGKTASWRFTTGRCLMDIPAS